jgi:hypothetical protein
LSQVAQEGLQVDLVVEARPEVVVDPSPHCEVVVIVVVDHLEAHGDLVDHFGAVAQLLGLVVTELIDQ